MLLSRGFTAQRSLTPYIVETDKIGGMDVI